MKKLLLLYFLFSCSIVKAQGTSDFPDSNYIFNESRWSRLFETVEPDEFDYTIYHKKDTLINAKTYALLKIKYSILFKDGPGQAEGTYAHGDIPIAYLFNDKASKKVYIKRLGFYKGFFNIPKDTVDQLLYDFDLKLGDVYPLTTSNLTLDTSIKVIAIDTIVGPDNIKRAVYVISNHGSPPFLYGYVVQGLCGKNGILGSIFGRWDNYYQENLSCFTINNIQYELFFGDSTAYLYQSNHPCNKHIYLSSEQEKFSSISIYPNPFSQYLVVNTNGANIQSINIYDTLGELVYTNKNVIDNKIDLSILPKGIYLLKLRLDEKERVIRIAKE